MGRTDQMSTRESRSTTKCGSGEQASVIPPECARSSDLEGPSQPVREGASPEVDLAVPDLPAGRTTIAKISSRLRQLYEVSESSSRSIPMEGIRGLAVLLVFFVHFHGMFSDYLTPHSALFEFSKFWGLVGNTGVDLFFVLSGYLIYGALLRKRVPYLKFIKRRAERIYPTFLCVLGLYLLASAAVPSLNKIHGPFLSRVALIAANVLLLPGIFQITAIITVAWSLSFEFFFYITIPLIVRSARMADWKGRPRVIFFASVGVGYLVYSFTVSTSHVRLLMFISGIMLYEMISSETCKGILKKGMGDALAATAFASSLILVYALDTDKWLTFLPRTGNTVLPGITSYEGPYKVIVLTLSCFPFVLFCIAGQGFLARLFSWAPMRYLGNMSYSFYLLHGATLNALVLFLHLFFTPDGNSPILFCILLPIAFAVSWLTSTVLFTLIEKPISLGARPVLRRVVLAEPISQKARGLDSPRSETDRE